MLELLATKAKLTLQKCELLTAKSVNAFQVHISFTNDWGELTKTVIFKAGTVARSVVLSDAADGVATIPWEVLETPGNHLSVGVLGIKGEEIVLPTIWCDVGYINNGVAEAEPTQQPTPGEYAQIIAIMEETEAIAQSVRDDADNGVFNGADGADGTDGVSIVSVVIRDSRLYCTLSDGTEIDAGELPGSDGTYDHRELEHRDAADSHPMSAITGLSSALSSKQDTISDLATIRTGAEKGTTALQPSALNPYRTSQAQDLIDSTLQGEIEAIEGKVPASASAQNQLVSSSQMASALDGKQDTISDLSDIRAGAEKGETALQPSALNPYRTASEQNAIDGEQNTAISAIEGKIPSSASAQNPLVSSSQMSEAISAVEAKQLYKTAQQGSFATKAELLAATTFYNADGTVATPTKNDVAYVLADESHDGKLAKYVIAATDPAIVWGFVIAISGTDFTQDQLDALNSGITAAKRTGYDTHVADVDIHVTAAQKTAWNDKIDKSAQAAKTSEQTEAVGIDENGKLWIKPNSLTGEHHYTARWNKTNAAMTRLNDAAHITTATTNFCHRGSVNPNYENPFDKIYPWSGRKLCNIDIDAYRALTEGQSITRAVKAWEGDIDFSYADANGVWVYTPEFWGKSWDETVGTTEYRYFDVTNKPCGGYVHYKERIEGRWHGTDKIMTIDGAEKHCLIPSVGMPAKSIAMSTLHTYAKNWGATLDSIFSIDANDLLMIVEFATMNSQSAIGSGVNSMYRQSSDLISAAATESTVVKVSKSAGSAFCIPGAIFDIGTANGGTQVGSFLVVSAVTDPDDSTLLDVTLNAPVTVTTSNYWSVHGMGNSADADIGSQSGYIGTNGKSIAYYRGEELFGNMFFYILGAYRQTGTQHVFIAHDDNEADAADALNASLHIDTGIALASAEGYVKKLGILSRSGLLCCPPFCTEKGGDSSNPVGDYHYITASAGNTVLIRGGHAPGGAYAGAFYGNWAYAASNSYWGYAARPRLKNPTFPNGDTEAY